MIRVLAAGDRFVLTSLFVDALRREVAADLEIRGPELEDSTVGLVGYGAIGSRVARMVAGLGAHVVVHDPYVAPEALGGPPGCHDRHEGCRNRIAAGFGPLAMMLLRQVRGPAGSDPRDRR